MKIVILILIMVASLFAKQKQICFSVQLASEYRFQNYDLVQNYYYPKGCKYMVVGRTLTVRCGCYSDEKQANKQLANYKKNYPDAELLRIYKRTYQKAKFIIYNKNKKFKKVIKKKKEKKVIKKKILKPIKKKINVAKEMEQELRLMLQVFLYKGDLINAYKVAAYGVKRYRKTYYWNQKMAEVCRWSGRFSESMKYLRRVYEIRYNKKIENELINYGMKTYQYEKVEPLVVRRAMRNPTEKNIDLLIKLYKDIGFPEKVVKILDQKYRKNPQNRMLVTKMLKLSLEIGDLDLAQKYVNILESSKPYSQKDAALISRYYYIKHNIVKAYKALAGVKNLNIVNKQDNIRYYELLSDLSWYLQKSLIAAKASKKLIDLNSARLDDYERAMFGFREVKPKIATRIAKKAYKKFKLSYLFYTYANAAINDKKFKELQHFMLEIERSKNLKLYNESMYWIIKSKVYKHFKKLDLASQALKKALSLSPDDFRIKLMLISYYIEVNDAKKVKSILLELENSNALVPSMYLSVASAYYYLNDINRAVFYMQKLKSMDSPATKLLSFKFLQAYIYQAQGNTNAFMKMMKEIAKELKAKAKRNPKLKKKDQFLSNYLRATIHIWPAEKFRKKLKKAKKYLSKSNYNDIRYSFAIKHKAYAKSSIIYRKTQNKALWLHFSNSLVVNNHSDIEDILRDDLDALAVLDASKAAYDDGQISLAQTMAFKGLTQNDHGDNAYIQHLDYSKQRSSKLQAHFANTHIDPIIQNSLTLTNENYIGDNFYIFEGFGVNGNRIVKPSSYVFVPAKSYYGSVGFKRLCPKGYGTFELEYYNALKNYFGIKLSLHHNLSSSDKSLDIILGKNQPTKDGLSLMFGGKQDYAKMSFAWKLLKSTTIISEYINATFESQDNVYLGYAHFINLFLNRQIHNGYPDMRAGLSYQYAYYHENLDPNGVIDTMRKRSYAVLAQTSSTIGASFSYGMANRANYTRVWRPYMEISTSYNDITQDPSFNFNIGYGGKLIHQDHLNFGASRAESIAGISSYELYVNYLFYY